MDAKIPVSVALGSQGRRMTGQALDPQQFFAAYPRFIDTSETGPWLDRLNARYLALIHSNRALIDGATVLDLASHDGRFSFAALKNGALHVVGIEHEPRLLSKAYENMEFYDVPRAQYDFVQGDIFDQIEAVDRCDVVFCFGILYHINNHMLLLSKIAATQPHVLIIDSHISQIEKAVIELRSGVGESPPPRGSHIEGHPSKAALEAMLTYFGWSVDYFDWRASGLVDVHPLEDYRTGRRITAVVTCSDQVYPPEVLQQAVESVFARQPECPSQWRAIKEVAPQYGMSPQWLRFWVDRIEREAGRRPGVPKPLGGR
jgi:hypothetical protein